MVGCGKRAGTVLVRLSETMSEVRRSRGAGLRVDSSRRVATSERKRGRGLGNSPPRSPRARPLRRSPQPEGEMGSLARSRKVPNLTWISCCTLSAGRRDRTNLISKRQIAAQYTITLFARRALFEDANGEWSASEEEVEADVEAQRKELRADIEDDDNDSGTFYEQSAYLQGKCFSVCLNKGSSVSNSTSLLALQSEMVEVHAQLQRTISALEEKLDNERNARKVLESASKAQQIKAEQANAAVSALRKAYDDIVEKLKRSHETIRTREEQAKKDAEDAARDREAADRDRVGMEEALREARDACDELRAEKMEAAARMAAMENQMYAVLERSREDAAEFSADRQTLPR